MENEFPLSSNVLTVSKKNAENAENNGAVGLVFISFLCYYLALPPVGWWPLVFLVPAGWTAAIYARRTTGFFRFYGTLWLAAALFWGATIFWITFPCPFLWIAYFALCGWLALFFPLFIGAARSLVWRGVPCVWAAGISWVGVEWFRKHLLGGFSFASLEHALYLRPEWIQTADLFGEYTVGAAVVLAGGGLGVALWNLFRPELSGKRRLPRSVGWVAFSVFVLAALFFYGRVRIDAVDAALRTASGDTVRVALLQDGETFSFPVSEEENLAVHRRYMQLSEEAAAGEADLIVWPEGTFARPFYTVAENGFFPGMETLDAKTRSEQVEAILAERRRPFEAWRERLGRPILVGGTSFDYDSNGEATVYNSGWYVRTDGRRERYDKVRRVMFGEYIPLLEWLPKSVPLATLCQAIASGEKSGLFFLGENDKASAMTTICFESSIPHFIRRQLIRCRRGESTDPDFLLNISNDGWFRGGSENAFHAATYVFRAVETRKPVLAAVHGDASRAVDPAGRIFAEGPKGASEAVWVEWPVGITLTSPWSGTWGEVFTLFPPICALVVLFSVFNSIWRARKKCQ